MAEKVYVDMVHPNGDEEEFVIHDVEKWKAALAEDGITEYDLLVDDPDDDRHDAEKVLEFIGRHFPAVLC